MRIKRSLIPCPLCNGRDVRCRGEGEWRGWSVFSCGSCGCRFSIDTDRSNVDEYIKCGYVMMDGGIDILSSGSGAISDAVIIAAGKINPELYELMERSPGLWYWYRLYCDYLKWNERGNVARASEMAEGLAECGFSDLQGYLESQDDESAKTLLIELRKLI